MSQQQPTPNADGTAGEQPGGKGRRPAGKRDKAKRDVGKMIAVAQQKYEDGKVKAAVAYKRHMFSNKPQKMKRQARGTFVLSESDAKIVRKYFLPNA